VERQAVPRPIHRDQPAGPGPFPVVVDILIGVLHGLHAAHEATNEQGEPLHIVHRDVSPQNIVVGTDGVARVLDFGVAKAAGRMHETHDGQAKGKVRYMPLEQITGKGVTRAVDIYAASVVLWEALTGTRLFTGATDMQVFEKVMRGDVPPPFRATRRAASRTRPERPGPATGVRSASSTAPASSASPGRSVAVTTTASSGTRATIPSRP